MQPGPNRRSATGRLLQFGGHLLDHGIQGGEGVAGVLTAHVGAKVEGGRGVEILDEQTIRVVDHDAEQVAHLAEDEVAARGIEFAEHSLQDAAVQFHIGWRAEINLEPAFAIIAFARADQDRILEFERRVRDLIDFRPQLLR